jgi:hypothetical protein
MKYTFFRAAASRREVVGSGDPIRGRSRLFLEQLRAQVFIYFYICMSVCLSVLWPF